MSRCCSVSGCEEPVYAAGYCEVHYHRNRRTGSPERAAGRVCRVPGCGRPHYGRGLCDLHRSQAEEKAREGEIRTGREQRVTGTWGD